jgi:hypothetical protein
LRARATVAGSLAHLRAVLPWVPVALALALAVGTLVLDVLDGRWDDAPVTIPSIAFAAVGSIVLWKRPGNPIGWLFCLIGLTLATAVFATAYGYHALVARPGSLSGGSYAAFIGSDIWAIAFYAGVALLLLFPDGRLPSRRWRPLLWLQVVGLLLYFVGVLEPGTLEEAPFTNVEKPFSIGGVDALAMLAVAGWAILVVSLILAATALVVRYRRSEATEREQLKWMASTGVVFAVGFAVQGFAEDAWPSAVQETAGALAVAAMTAIPIAAGFAIFKYRLYEIDVIIRRTLVYGVVTAALAGLYFAIVLILQQVFSSFAGGSELAIAGSTLAVAALFRPVRNRIQAFVDRRFYRRRYDTQRTLEAFSARLREELDLGTLRRELLQVVDETMRPADVSLWLRGQGPVVERFPAKARDDFRTVPGGSP